MIRLRNNHPVAIVHLTPTSNTILITEVSLSFIITKIEIIHQAKRQEGSVYSPVYLPVHFFQPGDE